MAILYAALLQVENQEVAAIDALRMWRAAAGDEVDVPVKGDGTNWETWYELRLRSTEVWLFETLRRRDPQQATAFADNYLQSLESYLELLQNLAPVRDRYTDIFPVYQFPSGQTSLALASHTCLSTAAAVDI